MERRRRGDSAWKILVELPGCPCRLLRQVHMHNARMLQCFWQRAVTVLTVELNGGRFWTTTHCSSSCRLSGYGMLNVIPNPVRSEDLIDDTVERRESSSFFFTPRADAHCFQGGGGERN